MIIKSKINPKTKIKINTHIKHIFLFIFMMLIVLCFKQIFGSNNTLIGISTVILLLILIQKDISKHLFKNSMKIIITNLIIGITAFIACKVPIFSLIIVFIIIFLICILTKDINEKIYLPFAYEFIFLLSTPTDLNGLTIRLISLIVGSLIVIGFNLLIYKVIRKNKSNNKNNNENNPKDKNNKYKISNEKNPKDKNNKYKISNEKNPKDKNNKYKILNENNPKNKNNKYKLSNEKIKENITSKFKKNKSHYIFAIELAILVSIFEFMDLYLKIPNAKWLCYLAIGLIWPNINLNHKSFGKIKGCIIGIFVFILIDLLFLNPNLFNVKYLMNIIPNLKNIVLTSIAIVSAYFYGHYSLESNKFTIKATFTTLISLSYAYLTIPLSKLLIERFLIILFGVIFCLALNYLIRKNSKINV